MADYILIATIFKFKMGPDNKSIAMGTRLYINLYYIKLQVTYYCIDNNVILFKTEYGFMENKTLEVAVVIIMIIAFITVYWSRRHC